MTYKTHKQFGILFSLIALMVLYRFNEFRINYYIAMVLILPASNFGARIPDYDHNWGSVRDKTILAWIINKAIHMTGGRHRSWQTHSWDIALVFLAMAVAIPTKWYDAGGLGAYGRDIMMLILVGIASGWISHLVSDMLTWAGVRVSCISNKKIRLVPKRFLGIQFKTGEEWESFVFTVTKVINVAIAAAAIGFAWI